MADIKLLSNIKCFGGYLKRYSHLSKATACEMKFSVFLPKESELHKVPVVWYLSGLTCTDLNFIEKAGAQKEASKHGIALVSPDTSPRDCNIEGDSLSWDFGIGAGFYIDATEPKWSAHYKMFTYITQELPKIIVDHFPILENSQSITGHSMGGHGALICAMKNPGRYRSVSAFAPISNPSEAPWGQKAFTGYLGANREQWKKYDATELIKSYEGPELNLLIDLGTEDSFYKQKQLLPENFKAACEQADISLTLRFQEGYDHSYHFVSSFIPDHIEHHAKILKS